MFLKQFRLLQGCITIIAAAAAILLVVESSSAQAVRLRSNINPTCTASNQTLKFADIYGDGNIAVMGTYGCKGAFIFDISDPDDPKLASHYNPMPNQSFLEAIVIGNRGYFGSGGTSPSAGTGGDGIHIVDLSNPYSPVLLGKVNTSNGGFSNIHEMMVFDQGASRYLLENSNSTGTTSMRILDITNPTAPVLKHTFSATNGGWIHAMHIRGNRLYLSAFFSNPRVEIFNIDNLAAQAPSFLGAVNVGLSSNHSTWTSEDGNYLYSAREISNSAVTNPGDIRVYDVSNPAAPFLIRSISMAELQLNAVTPHNPVVMGDKLYVSWYQAGTQVFDITTPNTPKRIGQYDTFGNAFTEEQRQELSKQDPSEMVCGRNLARETFISGYDGNWAVFPFLGEDKVLIGDLANGLFIVDVTEANSIARNKIADFDGDRRSDLSVYSPASGLWTTESSSGSDLHQVVWGEPGDVTISGDFDGDGKSDRGVWRPSNGRWYIYGSTEGFYSKEFGINGDVPVAADYDADGRTDLAVYRPSNNTWYLQQSLMGFRTRIWGTAGDIVTPGDFDGDGKADLAVWRPSNGTWYVLQSSSNIYYTVQWGQNGDKPLIGDFTGDKRVDYAIYRPTTGTWYVRNSADLSTTARGFGESGDTPIPADYDGDGKADIAVYRASNQNWFHVNSSDGGFVVRQFGAAGDVPVPAAAQPR